MSIFDMPAVTEMFLIDGFIFWLIIIGRVHVSGYGITLFQNKTIFKNSVKKGRVAITSDYCPFSKPNFRAYKGILLMQTARVCSRMV